MREEPQPGELKGKIGSGSDLAGSELERRFRWALALYAGLAVLVWFTIGEGKVFVLGRPVEIRLLPLVVIGGLVLRTILALQAEKIRRGGDRGGSSTPKSF
jgi:hypothetical protein